MKSLSISQVVSLTILLLLLARVSYALDGGNEVGNGGNAIVCPKQVQLLDLYEAATLRGMKIDPAIHGNDPFEIAKARVEILRTVNPQMGNIIQSGLDRLSTDISFEKEIKLKAIDDSLHSFEPSDPGCHVEQLAVYRKKVLPQEKRVLVNEVLWKRLPPIHQAGLLLHESIYKYLSNLGETNSSKSRYLVTYMLSSAFTPERSEDYWKLIRELRLPIYR